MALGIEEARAMVAAARHAGCLLDQATACWYARSRPTGTSRSWTAAGTHGRLLGLSTWRLRLLPSSRRARPQGALSVDPTTRAMTFDFDFVAGGLYDGRPSRLSATGTPAKSRHSWATTMAAAPTRCWRAASMPAGSPFTVGFRALFDDGPASSCDRASLEHGSAAHLLHARRRPLGAACRSAVRRQSLRG